MSTPTPKTPVDRKALADDFPSRYAFYGLHRFISEEERDEIIAALNRPLLEAVPSERSAIPQGYCSLHVEASAPCAQAGHCLVEGDLGVQRAIHDRAAPSAIGPSQEAIDFEEASRDHRDAERYRWLLEQWSTHHGAHHVEWRFDIGCAEVYGLEALIDKAMEAK